MKKLLYVSFENSENRASGVNKKISGHIKAFEGEGYAVDLIAHYQNHIAFYHGKAQPRMIEAGIPWRISLCNWAARHASDYDVAYIRFQFFCPFVLNMVKSFHKAGVKTVMEIPTYPYVPELKKQGARGVPKRMIDASFRRVCARYIDRFAAPLYGEPIMGKPCIEIRNGIEVDEISPRQVRDPDGKIHLLAVAMMAPWQGYDRLIEGMHQYYATGGKMDIILHLVGQGPELERYRSMSDGYDLKNRVLIYGQLHGDELDAMYNIADIGVGSLGVHRKNVRKTNTLKVLEYIAKGLPVICEHSEYGIPKNNPYRFTVADDDSSLDINAILRFYDSIYKGRKPESIVGEIREECRRNCSVTAGLRGVIEFLQ